MPLNRGRLIDDRDVENGKRVVVVNEAFGKKSFPTENPIGHRIAMSAKTYYEIVGVVGDVKQMGLDLPGLVEMYFSYRQDTRWSMQDLAVRVTGSPLSFANQVTAAIHAIDPQEPVANVRSLDDMLDRELEKRRIQTILLGAFAGVAVLLAVLGIYGVLASSVARRTPEMGLRMALGAMPGDVLRMVLRQGLALVALGCTLGLIAAFALTRLLATLLYGVSPTDALTFATVPLFLAAVAIGACWAPARRAAKVDPMTALRYE